MTALEETSDPKQVYGLEARFNTFGIIDDDEVRRFARPSTRGPVRPAGPDQAGGAGQADRGALRARGRRVDRLAGDGDHTIANEMDDVPVSGQHHVEVRDDKGRVDTATVELKYRRIRVLPPIGKQKRYPALTLTVLHAQERKEPTHRPRIDWKLITDLPVGSRKAAIEKLRWYALRWKIEVFHKILKSGCRAEEARLRTAERLVNLISVFCILSWRVFWMTMINRTAPDVAPALALTEVEMRLLDQLVSSKNDQPPRPATLSAYLIKIARLGGYLARKNDPPPGNTVMWRGLSRLTDIKLGAMACAELVGN